MATTCKRTTISLTKQDLRELEELAEYFGETRTQVIKRALLFLHYLTFNKQQNLCKEILDK